MKTLPIRCRAGDKRPIRAIAFEAADSGDASDQNETKHRDSCPTLKFFEDAKDAFPESWLDLFAVIDETARNGPPENRQKFNFLTDGLYELKSWKLRLICFFDDDSLIVCTHGFFKHRQETPKEEKDRAKKIRKAYYEAKKRGNLYHVQPHRQ